jgi:hypothetical protein
MHAVAAKMKLHPKTAVAKKEINPVISRVCGGMNAAA